MVVEEGLTMVVLCGWGPRWPARLEMLESSSQVPGLVCEAARDLF